MTDKPKRKNDQPIPRRYWWFFGILTLVLLIGLRFPVRILSFPVLNPLLYATIGIACLLEIVHFIRQYRWKRSVMIVMVACSILAFWHTFSTSVLEWIPQGKCDIEPYAFTTTYHCMGQCPTELPMGGNSASYITIGNSPIAIQIQYEQIGCFWVGPLF